MGNPPHPTSPSAALTSAITSPLNPQTLLKLIRFYITLVSYAKANKHLYLVDMPSLGVHLYSSQLAGSGSPAAYSPAMEEGLLGNTAVPLSETEHSNAELLVFYARSRILAYLNQCADLEFTGDEISDSTGDIALRVGRAMGGEGDRGGGQQGARGGRQEGDRRETE